MRIKIKIFWFCSELLDEIIAMGAVLRFIRPSVALKISKWLQRGSPLLLALKQTMQHTEKQNFYKSPSCQGEKTPKAISNGGFFGSSPLLPFWDCVAIPHFLRTGEVWSLSPRPPVPQPLPHSLSGSSDSPSGCGVWLQLHRVKITLRRFIWGKFLIT